MRRKKNFFSSAIHFGLALDLNWIPILDPNTRNSSWWRLTKVRMLSNINLLKTFVIVIIVNYRYDINVKLLISTTVSEGINTASRICPPFHESNLFYGNRLWDDSALSFPNTTPRILYVLVVRLIGLNSDIPLEPSFFEIIWMKFGPTSSLSWVGSNPLSLNFTWALICDVF